MTVKVTLEFDTAAEAAEYLLAREEPQGTGADAGEKKPRGRPPRKAEATASPTPAAASPAAPGAQTAAVASAATGAAPSAATSASAPAAVPYKDVADAITKLSETDYPGAVALLKSFGANTAPQLKPEQFAEFVAQANAKLAALVAKPAGPPSLL